MGVREGVHADVPASGGEGPIGSGRIRAYRTYWKSQSCPPYRSRRSTGESLTAVLNCRDSFAADRAAERYLGRFDHNQFAVEHLEGSVELTGLKKSAPGQWALVGLLGRRTADRAKGI